MNFSVRLGAEHIAVDPGDSVPLAIEVTNAGDSTDQFEISVEGLDSEWTAIPTPSFSVPSGATVSQSIFFQPGRGSESTAATYAFTAKVRSLESGDLRALTGILQVKPFIHLSMEILPKKGVYSPMVRENVFQATVINLGNSEQELQLFGSDPDEALAYSFEPEHIAIGPGQQKEVDVIAEPAQSRPIAGPRLYGFTISARSPAAIQARLREIRAPNAVLIRACSRASSVGSPRRRTASAIASAVSIPPPRSSAINARR